MARIKMSVSLDQDVVEALDGLTAGRERKNRSEVVEQALRHWLRHHRRTVLDRQIEAYYRSLEEEEREADRDWAGLGTVTVEESW